MHSTLNGSQGAKTIGEPGIALINLVYSQLASGLDGLAAATSCKTLKAF